MFDRDNPDYYERTYAFTAEGQLVDTVVLDRRDFPQSNCEDEAVQLAYSLAKASGHTIEVHAHNQWWPPIYTIEHDGQGYRHATGRKAGPFSL